MCGVVVWVCNLYWGFRFSMIFILIIWFYVFILRGVVSSVGWGSAPGWRLLLLCYLVLGGAGFSWGLGCFELHL